MTRKIVVQVMLRGGQRWWKAAGRQMEMVFELNENGSMMQVFKRYVEELQQQGRLER